MTDLDPPRPAGLPPLGQVLPPLLLGTATFNTQYVADPAAMPYRSIVRRAVAELGVCGFDTSPYYGPAEALLGEALAAAGADRRRCFLQTKAGRVHSRGFDYRPAAVQASVRRSLQRLRTDYVDLVFAHDAEFVAADGADSADSDGRPTTAAGRDAVVAAVRALRQLRAQGCVRYVGLSGFPVDVLADLAAHVRAATGEPVDAVLSYGHATVQNARLADPALLRRFRHDAGVAVVLNASLLNMGLLTARGVDAGPQAAWHPSPPPLRAVCAAAARLCETDAVADTDADADSDLPKLDRIEPIALRYALDTWARVGAAAGLGTAVRRADGDDNDNDSTPTVGPSVLGVTTEAELVETVHEWWSVLDGLGLGRGDGAAAADDANADADRRQQASRRRTERVRAFVEQRLWPVFGEWKDYAWPSPEPGWVNELAGDEVGDEARDKAGATAP